MGSRDTHRREVRFWNRHSRRSVCAENFDWNPSTLLEKLISVDYGSYTSFDTLKNTVFPHHHSNSPFTITMNPFPSKKQVVGSSASEGPIYNASGLRANATDLPRAVYNLGVALRSIPVSKSLGELTLIKSSHTHS